MATATAIIIGNEILSGKFADENGAWLARRCRLLGLDLVRLVFIPDIIETIAFEVRTAAENTDHVFTTGGIGPTHDDKTMEGIAMAFDVPLVRLPALENLIRNTIGDSVNEAALRMADVPEGTVLWNDSGLKFPVAACRNVVVFPGVPRFFQAKFEAIEHRFRGVRVETRQFRTFERETRIAAELKDAQDRWPSVDIGSYPRFDTSPVSVVVTLDGRNRVDLDECERWLQERISVQS